jgi:hypothetical protein
LQISKEEHNHVAHLHHTFKVIHQLCTAAGDRSFTTQDTFNNIKAFIKYINHLQITHHDKIWLQKTGSDEAFQLVAGLVSSG